MFHPMKWDVPLVIEGRFRLTNYLFLFFRVISILWLVIAQLKL